MRRLRQFVRSGVVLVGALTCGSHPVFAQDLAPPLPIPIVLGSPIIVPVNLLQQEAQAMTSHACTAQQQQAPAGTLQELLGAKVKEIRIIRVTPGRNPDPPTTGIFTPPAVTAVKRALRRHIRESGCAVHLAPNDRPYGGSVQADIEFEDGIKRTLITNGDAVAVQDRNGKAWFLVLV